MPLVTEKARSALATAALFAIAVALELVLPSRDRDEALAESLVGPATRIEIPPGPPAYRGVSATALFFERRGEQGPIRGVAVVEGETIRDVIVLHANEGTDRMALRRSGFAERFRGRPARPPVVVDAVSGATISSQAVIDAVNERLKAWRESKR